MKPIETPSNPSSQKLLTPAFSQPSFIAALSHRRPLSSPPSLIAALSHRRPLSSPPSLIAALSHRRRPYIRHFPLPFQQSSVSALSAQMLLIAITKSSRSSLYIVLRLRLRVFLAWQGSFSSPSGVMAYFVVLVSIMCELKISLMIELPISGRPLVHGTVGSSCC